MLSDNRIPAVQLAESMNNNMREEHLPRPYLGLSMSGETCLRYLQYYHYWCFTEQVSERIQRLFNVGHDAEDKIINDLLSNNIPVFSQQEAIVGIAGHWKGHIDGETLMETIDPRLKVDGLVEFKTHNDKFFKDLCKKGVKESQPKHYGQVQNYMGYRDLKYCFYVAYNKNDSSYYFEVIEFDEEYFEDSKHKQMEVITNDALFPKIGNGSKTWFACRFCNARDVCHNNESMPVTCRTCQHVDVEDNGVWACSKKRKKLTVDAQKEACGEYQLGDMFCD